MPPVTISPSGRVPGRAAEPSRSRVGDGGGLGCFLENMIGPRGFSGGRQFIGERAASEGSRGRQVGPRRGQGWAAPGGRLGAVGPPAGALLAPSLFLRKNKSCKLAAYSEKIPRLAFLKQKDSKNRNWHWASC